MKVLITVFLFLVCGSAIAADNSNIVISIESGAEVKIEWLGSEVDESEVEVAWEEGGQDALYFGNFCYNGKVAEVASILESLSAMDFLGDEYRIQNIDTTKPGKISYEVYDGPNETVAVEVTVTRCI